MSSDIIPWLDENLFYVTIHGSQAYGMSTDTSDLDVKGICIPPKAVMYDIFSKFEQAENNSLIENIWGYLRNPINPKFESVIYSLEKFFKLAAEVNPNIIELLYTESSDHLLEDNKNGALRLLFDHRNLFLSSKAKYTFTGYAHAQLAKINRHRKWLLNPQENPPVRADFGLPEEISAGTSEVFAQIRKQVDQWVLGINGLGGAEREELQQRCFESINQVSRAKVWWDNWPVLYDEAAIYKLGQDLNLGDAVLNLIRKEAQYKKAYDDYKSYSIWKANRNPARKVLEEKHKYDTKHGCHLVRLLHMGQEIIEQGKVFVKRHDADFLLSIRNGEKTYDWLMEYTEKMQRKIEAAYKYTELPYSTDKVALNNLYYKIVNLWQENKKH